MRQKRLSIRLPIPDRLKMDTKENSRKSGFVAIAGRPNAGKSTLMNRVLGSELSIVTRKAQTTRERVLGILTESRGQIVFVDTPGIHRAKTGGINAYMMAEAREALLGTACVWYIVDPASAVKHELLVLDLLKQAAGSETPIFLLLNKIDIKSASERIDPLLSELSEEMKKRGLKIAGEFRISAQKGKGVDELLAQTWELMPEGPLHYPDEEQISDRPMRFFVAEKIREQLFLQLGEELPYSCAVSIEKYDESQKIPHIDAVIYVERDSQKGMVVGKGGSKIKAIGQEARRTVEEFVGGKVFLGLQVKVLKDWTKNAEALKRMGYNVPSTKKPSQRKRA